MVGLGNPGPRYLGTRHNAGFQVVEAFGRRHAIAIGERADPARFGRVGAGRVLGRAVELLLPETWMNRSGEAVAAALGRRPDLDPAATLVVVYDDLDLPFGRIRVRPGGGSGGHRGMESIVSCLERRDFARLRFGVGRPPAGQAVIDYVLEPFAADERAQLPDRVANAVDALDSLIERGVERAMEHFNRDPGPATGTDT